MTPNTQRAPAAPHDESSTKSIPHNLEAEQSVLGALLVDLEAASEVLQVLTPDDFYGQQHARVFGAIVDLVEKHGTVDEILLDDELERRGEFESTGGLEFLDALVERLPAAANAMHYARIVREHSQLRRVLSAASDARQKILDDPNATANSVARDLQEALEAAQRDVRRRKLLRIDDLGQLACGEPLVDGFLGKESFAMLVAPPTSGKSFIAVDLSLRIAAGLNTFLGRTIATSGPTVYVLREGHAGFESRVRAWLELHQPDETPPFVVWPEPIDFFDRSTDEVGEFIHSIRRELGGNPSLVVLDTLFQLFGGKDPKSPEDMAAFVASCERIIRELDCTVLVIHHPPKGEVKPSINGFGSVVLTAALDTVAWVLRSENSVIVRTMKQKEGEPAELHGEFIKDTKWNSLVLDEVENGRNRLLAGEPVDSTVVRLAFTTYGVGQTFPGGELKTMFLEATDKKKSCYYNARTNLIKKEVLVEHVIWKNIIIQSKIFFQNF